jgi:alkylation response protein AidB-like acyl-CoA dehydrogenase
MSAIAGMPEVSVGVDAQGRRVLTHAEAATITPEALIGRARGMIPTLRERAARTEEARRLLPETFEDFMRAGFFRTCQPRRFGGFEMGMDVLQAILCEIGRGCGSSAWTLGILTGHAWWASQFPEAGQVEVFGDDGVALLPTGIFGRGGTARKVDGGYELSGRWAYQSGVDVSNWYGCGAVLEDGSGGPPAAITFIVPVSEGYVVDDWHTMGMRGSGSKTVVVEKAFVPERRAMLLSSVDAQETPGSRVHANPLYSTPLMAFISIEVTGAAVGVALGAVDTLEELGRTKPIRGRGGGGGETTQYEMSRPSFRRRLAEAKTLAETAKTMLISESQRLMVTSAANKASGAKMTREEIAEVTLNQSRIVDLSVQAVKHAFIAAGTSATVQGHPMERALRDVFTISTHRVLSFDQAAESWATAHYGL